jgi:hypothetical protein
MGQSRSSIGPPRIAQSCADARQVVPAVPYRFQRSTRDRRARSDLVCALWNCSMGCGSNRCANGRQTAGAASTLGAQSGRCRRTMVWEQA